MAKENETIADIIAEMRAREDLDGGDMVDNFDIYSGEYGGWDALMLIKAYADRLEAAHRREADYAREAYESALKAEREALREQYEAGALVDGTRGDCAKLREVVDAMMYEAFALCDSCVKPAAERGKLLAKWCNKLRAALAATEKEGGAK